MLELLLNRSIQVAQEQNITLGDTIIVDATHTHARLQCHSPLGNLRKQASLLRKSCYRVSLKSTVHKKQIDFEKKTFSVRK